MRISIQAARRNRERFKSFAKEMADAWVDTEETDDAVYRMKINAE